VCDCHFLFGDQSLSSGVLQERVSLYNDKVMKALDQSKGALQPTSAIDVGAANRFIEHAIPDLSADQKRRMWEVSKIQNQKQNHRKRSGGGSTIAPDLGPKLKRRSVAEDAADFLIEASKELLVIQQNQVLEDPP
jgi:exosome complex protein LRP1